VTPTVLVLGSRLDRESETDPFHDRLLLVLGGFIQVVDVLIVGANASVGTAVIRADRSMSGYSACSARVARCARLCCFGLRPGGVPKGGARDYGGVRDHSASRHDVHGVGDSSHLLDVARSRHSGSSSRYQLLQYLIDDCCGADIDPPVE